MSIWWCLYDREKTNQSKFAMQEQRCWVPLVGCCIARRFYFNRWRLLISGPSSTNFSEAWVRSGKCPFKKCIHIVDHNISVIALKYQTKRSARPWILIIETSSWLIYKGKTICRESLNFLDFHGYVAFNNSVIQLHIKMIQIPKWKYLMKENETHK